MALRAAVGAFLPARGIALATLALAAGLLAPALPLRAAPPLGPRPLSGWPVVVGNAVFGEIAAGDLDGDGRAELAVGLRDGHVHLLDGAGRAVGGWPQSTCGGVFMATAIGDIDGDGHPEVLAASHAGFLYVWRASGRALAGWPVDLRAEPVSRPLLLPPGPQGGPRLAIATADGAVYLLDARGRSCTGWPQRGGSRSPERQDFQPLAVADLDGDAQPEILYLSGAPAVLNAWTLTGRALPGFPCALGDKGLGLAVEGGGDGAIACTTERALWLLGADGKPRWRRALTSDTDSFNCAPAFLSGGNGRSLITAATRLGSIHLLRNDGEPVAGWPLAVGGFIYGLAGEAEKFGILSPPSAVDVDCDAQPEILVACYDQHLYCFELDGTPVPGWPLTFGDALWARPTLAQLDGQGGEELVAGQGGETVFAFALPETGSGRVAGPAATAPQTGRGRWPRAGLLAAALLVLGLAARWLSRKPPSETAAAARGGRAGALLWILAVLVLLRAGLLVGEVLRYRQAEQRLRAAAPAIERLLADAQAETQRLTENLAAALDSSLAAGAASSTQLLYQLERLADRARLNQDRAGLMVVDGGGEAIRAIGLARGWSHREDLEPRAAQALTLLDDLPVQVGAAALGGALAPGHLLVVTSALEDLPSRFAAAAGASAQLQLDGRTLAWAGGPAALGAEFWPWLGVIEATHEIPLPANAGGARLSLRLADESFARGASGWLDLLLLAALVLGLTGVLLRGAPRPALRRGGLILPGVAAVYLLGWLALANGRFDQRPVSLAGHGLEVLLHLLGATALLLALRRLLGEQRSRRLGVALLGSYLLASLLPLLLGLAIVTSLLQQTQRAAMRSELERLEDRAEHLVLAYMGMTSFQHSLSDRVRGALDLPPETTWINFVGEQQALFTYDLPAAYLTLSVEDRAAPAAHVTGFSWRVPNTEKFYAARPVWAGGGDPRGLFFDQGRPLVRVMRTLRTPDLEARLLANLPIDDAALTRIEERLRMLPFLPSVHLEPLWLSAEPAASAPAGWALPFATRLVHPARDWRTGEPRWLAYRARAYLPAGRDRWRVLTTVALLMLLPLAMSIWGAVATLRRTVQPLNRLLTGIRRVQGGDLDVRLGESGASEVAEAARAFDQMAAGLRDTVQAMAEKQKLEEISALKSHFISMVSHDLRTPLASIKGAAENLLAEIAGPVTERQRTYLAMILASSDNLQQMVTNLLDLSRIESGHLQLEREDLDLGREIDNLLRSLHALLEARGLSAQVAVDTGVARVRADRTRLWQVLGNLLANAVRYSPVNGQIRIGVSAEIGPDGAALLRTTIADEGPGIAPEERERIFEPFYSRSLGARDKAGAGLGLAIVRQLVELHGGSIRVDDRPAPGASLSFTLPRLPAQDLHSTCAAPAQTESAHGVGDRPSDAGTGD